MLCKFKGPLQTQMTDVVVTGFSYQALIAKYMIKKMSFICFNTINQADDWWVLALNPSRQVEAATNVFITF